MRDRLSKSPLSQPLTLSENFEIYECENFLLEGAVTSPARAYWAAHAMHFYFEIEGAAPYTAGDDFPQILHEVCEGLEAAGFDDQAAELAGSASELEFNHRVIRQYTAENLYEAVNLLLRRGHSGDSVATDPLVPWISHLNAILRNEGEWMKPTYRGCEMDARTIQEYAVDRYFVWASFTSVSTTREACLDGNVLFTITPRSALSEHGKRAPREISHLSDFPDENEALLPLGCAFRVVDVNQHAGRWLIDLDLLDHN